MSPIGLAGRTTTRRRGRGASGRLGAALLLAAACAEPGPTPPADVAIPADSALTIDRHDPPAGAGAMAPHLSATGAGLRLSWLEPTSDGGHVLRTAEFDGSTWEAASTVASGDDFFANWADVPAVVELPDGGVIAHWLARLGDETYAYGVRLARSDDGGGSWRSLGWLHDDRSPTEHGFVSWALAAGSPPLAVWLDGRRMAEGGPMELRAAPMSEGGHAGTVVDARVCECCNTAAVATDGGVVVAYRDRSGEEVRDVFAVRREADGWQAPVALGGEGWRLSGCPVNGPALAADGSRVAAAWFTAAGGEPRVRLAFSSDGGRSFGEPRTVTTNHPVGRVAVALAADGSALIAWLGRESGVGEDATGGVLWLRRAGEGPPSGEDGGPRHRIAEVSTARATGFPQLVRAGDRAYLAWVEAGEEPSRLAFASVALDDLPRGSAARLRAGD